VNSNIKNSLVFVVFLLLQIFIFNKINLFGYLNPYPYLFFILLYPVNNNKSVLLISSFTLGIILDMFANSGGIHALASVVLAYFRPNLFKFAFGVSYEYNTVKFADKISPERITLLLLTIFIHHFILFFFEFFRVDLIVTIILRTLLNTLITFLFSILILYLIKPNKK